MADPFSQQPGMQPSPLMPQDALSTATRLVNTTMDFLRANYTALFMKFLKVEAITLVVSTIMLLLFGSVLAGVLILMGMPLDKGLAGLAKFVFASTPVLAFTVLWSLFSIFAISWISRSISLSTYIMTQDQFAGRQSDLMGIFNRIKFPVLSYMVFYYALLIVFLGLPGIVVYLAQGSPGLFLICLAVYVIYMLLFLLIYSFFAQFWLWELIIAEKPAVEALGASLSLVRENLAGTFIFYIIRIAASVVIGIPFAIVSFIVEILARGLVAVTMVATQSVIALIGALAIYILAREVVAVFSGATVSAAMLPYTYSFWDAIRKK